MKKQILPQGLLLLCLLATLLGNAQITFNANTQQPPAYSIALTATPIFLTPTVRIATKDAT